ncbi:hypothetical protein [Streptomyces venezuelae]|uniref:hypothetical protein n=1 Tax=Streptomyces venezuelae TaxID=54571 RepID=UPI0033347CB1
MTLRTDEGHAVSLSGVRVYEVGRTTYNLTVAGLHTYYVLAGNTPVLVQNSTPSVPDGVIYLRTGVVTGEDYVGQAKSWDRYVVRQAKCARDYPNSAFAFEVLGRAAPGRDLDVLEESWMRAGGGKASVPSSVLTNKRVQTCEARYRAAGGTVSCS